MMTKTMAVGTHTLNIGPRQAALSPIVLRTADGAHELHDKVATGDISAVYRLKVAGAPQLGKVVSDASDNDLLAHERDVLTQLETVREGAAYFPQVTGHGTVSALAGVPFKPVPLLRLRKSVAGSRLLAAQDREALLFKEVPGLRTLTELRQMFPEGIPVRHMAWMFRRTLMALGFAHSVGIIHGAVVPDHLLFEPEEHGLVLVGWTAASVRQEPIRVISRRYRDWYPEEIIAKDPPVPGTDMFMAARCMEFAIGGRERAPRALRAFLGYCTQASPTARPRDAWDLMDEFNELAAEIWGAPRFTPLQLPTTPTEEA